MNAYRVGTYYEGKSADWCLEQGAIDIISSKGSHGLWDFVAEYPTRTEFIQVKKSKIPTLRVLYQYARSIERRAFDATDRRLYLLHVWEAYEPRPKVYPFIRSVAELCRRFPDQAEAIGRYAKDEDARERQQEEHRAIIEDRRRRKKARPQTSPPTDGASPNPVQSPGVISAGAPRATVVVSPPPQHARPSP